MQFILLQGETKNLSLLRNSWPLLTILRKDQIKYRLNSLKMHLLFVIL